jgi:hypothetical protein
LKFRKRDGDEETLGDLQRPKGFLKKAAGIPDPLPSVDPLKTPAFAIQASLVGRPSPGGGKSTSLVVTTCH